MGEKTGWTYIEIPASIAQVLCPGNRKGFRVKGKLDNYVFSQQSLLPMGEGNFILTINGDVRKKIRKQKDAPIEVWLDFDPEEPLTPDWIVDCLKDDPLAEAAFNKLKRGHQNYFIKWIESAKTEPTKAKRMAMTLDALVRGWGFSEMFQAQKANKLKP